MILDITFSESNQSFNPGFGEVHNISDGGYERGYAAGYDAGETDGYEMGVAEGYTDGYEDGLAARVYETWTITLTDGTVVEKEVALV